MGDNIIIMSPGMMDQSTDCNVFFYVFVHFRDLFRTLFFFLFYVICLFVYCFLSLCSVLILG